MNGSYGGVLNAHAIASQAERGFFMGIGGLESPTWARTGGLNVIANCNRT